MADISPKLLEVSLDSYFQLAELAKTKNCPDLADSQFRALKRILKKVNLPKYQQKLETATSGYTDEGRAEGFWCRLLALYLH